MPLRKYRRRGGHAVTRVVENFDLAKVSTSNRLERWKYSAGVLLFSNDFSASRGFRCYCRVAEGFDVTEFNHRFVYFLESAFQGNGWSDDTSDNYYYILLCRYFDENANFIGSAMAFLQENGSKLYNNSNTYFNYGSPFESVQAMFTGGENYAYNMEIYPIRVARSAVLHTNTSFNRDVVRYDVKYDGDTIQSSSSVPYYTPPDSTHVYFYNKSMGFPNWNDLIYYIQISNEHDFVFIKSGHNINTVRTGMSTNVSLDAGFVDFTISFSNFWW